MARGTSAVPHQPVDDAARRQAGSMLRRARHGALATLDSRNGSPRASRISLATGQTGDPIFLISRLSAHFDALETDPRCSLLIGEPGSGDPLAYPRMTLTGRAGIADGNDHAALRRRFLARHPKAMLYADFADFAFWRLNVESASLICGFGKAHELERDDLCVLPIPELETVEPGAVEHMNESHRDAIDLYAAEAGFEGKGWRLATLDPTGLDLVRGDETARFWFNSRLASADQLRPRLIAAVKRVRPT